MILRGLIAIALLLTLPLPARAATLFVCAEDIDCIRQGTITSTTDAAFFNTGYARLGNLNQQAGTTTIPAPNRVETPNFTPTTDFWFSAVYAVKSGSTAAVNNVFAMLSDAGGVVRLVLRGTGVNDQSLKLTTRNAAGTLVDIATATGSLCTTALASFVPCKLDIHVVYSTTGSVDVYNNGVNILTFSGDVTTNAATQLAKVACCNPLNITNAFGIATSEVIVATTDTRSLRLVTWAPAANGNTQDWTGTATDINETTLSDGSNVNTTTSNQKAQFTVGALPSGTFAVKDVVQSGRVLVGTTGPQNFRWSLRVTGADYDNGADIPALNSYANYQHYWGLNSPATGVPWTQSEITSSFNSGLLSKP